MKLKLYVLPTIIILSLTYPGGLSNAAKDTTRRFALVVGANDGGKSRTKLRYAVLDAKSFMNVINKIGGVYAGDGVLMSEPSRQNFMLGINALKDKMRKARETSKRVEIIFYYSGHSDEESILLGNDKISYKEIKGLITDLPADMRIAVLDSCSSGAFTRIKGGRARSPFLIDSSYNMKGEAFMTSSSIDEASQESDRIKGSFFTHSLVAGLMGAADITQDGRVTLSEAYQYTYNETLTGTEKTLSGPQHPNYAIQMSGTGDVVMTDIRKSSSVIVITENISGRIFIRDKNDNLICELRKPAGRNIQIGLEEGGYTIINSREGKLFEANIKLAAGEQLTLSPDKFTDAKKEHTSARGDSSVKDEDYRIIPWDFSLFPMVTANQKTVHYYSINLFGSYSARLDGFSIGIGPGIVGEDVRGLQLNVFANYAGSKADGAQLSHILNIARGDLTGVQAGSILNYTYGDVKGVQASGVFNYAGKNQKGIQASGVSNIAGGNITGVQLAGIGNYAGDDMKGVQIGGVFNYSGEKTDGVQLAGVANKAGDAKGVQIGGVLNIAGNFKGLQLGLINISKIQNGLSIGFINISKNGSFDIAAWTSSLMAANAGLIFRANHIYTMFSAGWMNLDKDINDSGSLGFHFGIHIPVRSFYIDTDAGTMYIDNKKMFSRKDNEDQQVLQGRILAGYNITTDFSVFAGGGLNYIYNDIDSDFKDGKFKPLYFAGLKYSIYNGI